MKKIVGELKDDNEQYRKIVIETVRKIVATYGVADIDSDLEEKLMDGINYSFQK